METLMKKHLLTTLTATIFLAVSGFSTADEYTDVDHYGIYLGAGYGLVNVDSDEDFDNDDNVSNVFIGGQINQALSI